MEMRGGENYLIVRHREDVGVSLADFLISHLLSMKSTKIYRKNLYTRINKRRNTEHNQYNTTLHRLKKRGFIEIDSSGLITFNKNKERLFVRLEYIKEKPGNKKSIIIIFDIPEKHRKIRNWLRNQLKIWDFEMVQQSVWVGKGPLPRKFTDHLKILGVHKNVKMFSVVQKEIR